MNSHDKLIEVSRFNDMYDKNPKPSTVEEFVKRVKSTLYKEKTELYRKLLAEDKTAEAAALKKKFPGITMTGVFEGGRADKNLQSFSRFMMFDWDDTCADTQAVKTFLKTLPYVHTAWISVSAEGVKAGIRVEVADEREYAVAYTVIAEELNRLMPDHQVDMACANVGRYCSEVWDPEVYYNPEATPFPWREEGERRMHEEDARRAREEEALHAHAEEDAAAKSVRPDALQGPGTGMMSDFLEHSLTKHPFVSGHRHEAALALGRAARCKNLSPQEQASLVVMVVQRFASDDFTAAEIESCIRAGYQYLSDKPPLARPYIQGSKVQGFPMNPDFRATVQEEQEQMLENSNKLRAELPHFSQEVYDHLPQLLTKGVALAHGIRERDMLLMGMMTHLSAALPDVRFRYSGMEMSPHLFYVGVSHAGTGKGIVTLAAGLTKGIHDYYVHQSEEEMKAYEERMRVWEDAATDQRRKHQHLQREPKPEEPKRTFFQIPANLSKAMFYRHLRDNGDLGGVIHASEIDTLASAMGQDYGKQDDALRNCFQHESLSATFKVDGAPICIDHPRLALCLTGTPNQLVTLVKSQEDGLYSRLATLTAETRWKWRSAAPHPGEVEYQSFFEKLGAEVLQAHLMMKGRITDVHFTTEQWEEHTRFFSTYLQDVAAEGEDSPGAVVIRHGLIAMRLAAVLTALRKCEDELWAAGYRLCTDEDFHTAMLMVKVLIEHSLLLSSSLPELALKALPLRKFHQFQPVLDRMEQEFSFTDFVTEATRQGLSLSTGKRHLKKAEEIGMVVRQGKLYKKMKRDVAGKVGS